MSAVTVGTRYRPVAYLRAPQPKLRLTRRGQIVLTALIAIPLIVAAFLFVVNGGGAAATQAGSPVAPTYVTVEAGQSLWQLAQDVAPKADPRDVIADILSVNGLTSAEVFPGQRLAIPNTYLNK